VETVSKTEFAKGLGLTKGRVSQLLARGLPVTKDGRIPLGQARSWYEATIHKTRKRGPHPKAVLDPAITSGSTFVPGGKNLPAALRLLEAQASKEEQLAILRTMEVERRKGVLVEIEDVERVWGSIVSAAQARMLLLPDKLAPKVAPVTDVLECRAIIDREIKSALTYLIEYHADAA